MSKEAAAKEEDEIKSKLLVKENNEEEEEELLLPLPGNGTDSGKKHQKVQWDDNHLTQVLEYQPSEVSEIEDEEPDVCLCNIM